MLDWPSKFVSSFFSLSKNQIQIAIGKVGFGSKKVAVKVLFISANDTSKEMWKPYYSTYCKNMTQMYMQKKCAA